MGIFGSAFSDLNNNQLHDGGEPTLSGVVINLEAPLGTVIATGVTDVFGQYQFVNLPFGTYWVRALTPTGWYATTPTIVTVNMFGCGSYVGLDFGFNQTPPTPIPTATPTSTGVPTATPTSTSTRTPTLVPTDTPTRTPTSTSTPTNTPTNTPTATSTPMLPTLTVTVNPTSSSTCAVPFQFTGTINMAQPGIVRYRWAKSDGSFGAPQSLTFLAPGSQNVSDSWTISHYNGTGWEMVQILAVGALSSTPIPPPPPGSSPTPVTVLLQSNQASFTAICP